MLKRILGFVFIAMTMLTACSQSDDHQLINANPDPDGEPWLVVDDDSMKKKYMEEMERLSEVKFDSNNTRSYAAASIPIAVDNSTKKYFRPIFKQVGGSCSQASGIGYIFTYEINALRNLDSSVAANQYPTHFTYNFLNRGSSSNGSSTYDGWFIALINGIPDVVTYGGSMSSGGYTGWMSGYDKYLSGMKNRALGFYKIDTTTPTGLEKLKKWLNDHGNGSAAGGLAKISVDFYGSSYKTLDAGTPQAGKKIVISWGDSGGHAMTLAGYDDSVKYDYNGDGEYTNDVDINNDGIVDMKDWEIGALIVVNSHGKGWQNKGKAYMMYRLLAEPDEDGGIWRNSIMVVKVSKDYKPKLTMKVKMKHSSREMIRVVAGVSSNLSATKPAFVKNYEMFNHNGGDYPMLGSGKEDPIEFGLDIAPLLQEIKGNNGNLKFFLQIYEEDPDADGTGKVESFSVIDYTNGIDEVVCGQTNVNIVNNGVTTLSLVKTGLQLYPPVIYTDQRSGLVNIKWNGVNNATSYRVYRDGKLIGSTSGTTYKDSNVTNGAKYSYAVTSFSAGSESSLSKSVTATPMASIVPPYFEGFEGGVFPPLGWNKSVEGDERQISFLDDSGWDFRSTFGGGISNYAYISNARNCKTAILETPLFKLSSSKVSYLEFLFKPARYYSDNIAKTYCEISNDYGKTWKLLKLFQSEQGAEISPEKISLAAYSGKYVKIRWRDVIPTVKKKFSNPNLTTIDNVSIVDGTKKPKMNLSSNSVDFGIVYKDIDGKKEFTISNSGNSELSGYIKSKSPFRISCANYDYASNDMFFSIPPGGSKKIYLKVEPYKLGTLNGNYTIITNDPDKLTVSIPASAEVKKKPVKKYDQVYLRGTWNNWVADNNSKMALVDDNLWQIENVIFNDSTNERFKFDIEGDWTLNFGDDNNDKIADKSGDDIHVNGNSVYTITFNDSTLKYTLVGEEVVGKATISYDVDDGQTGYGSDAAVVGLEVQLLKDNSVIATKKITDPSSGYEPPKTVFTNLKAGNYTVKLNKKKSGYQYKGEVNFSIDLDNKNVYKVMLVSETISYDSNYNQVYLRGSCNGWVGNDSSKMELVDNNLWRKKVTFGNTTNERFKFDIKGDWTLNFGDNNGDNIAEQSGDDIIVTGGEGDYIVTFNDSTREYSVEKDEFSDGVAGISYTGQYGVTYALHGMTVKLYKNGSYYMDEIIEKESHGAAVTKIVNLPAGNYKLVLNSDYNGKNYSGTIEFTISEANPSDYGIMHVTEEIHGNYSSNYDSVYIRGTFNNWEAADDSKMKLVADNIWKKTIGTGSASNQMFKFDIHGDWTLNFGDNNNDLTADQNGNNIHLDSQSSYVIKFNDETMKYTIVKD